MTDLYTILGLSTEKDISSDDIKRSYRKAALQHHPDRGGDKTVFQSIQKAYDILSDPEKRSRYDNSGIIDDSEVQMPDIASMFNAFGSMGTSMFNAFRQPRPLKGSNKTHDIGVSLTDLYNGKKFTLKMKRDICCKMCNGEGGVLEDCKTCKGTGIQQRQQQMGPFGMATMIGACQSCLGERQKLTTTCNTCSGRKLVESESVLDVVINPGMSDGDTIIFPEHCSESPMFETPGDVILVIRQLDGYGENSKWIRNGWDLTYEIHITLAESMLGFERVLTGHPSSKTILVVWNNGPVRDMEILRIKEKGMPDKLTGDFGYLLLMCRVQPQEQGWTAEQQKTLMSIWPEWIKPTTDADEIIERIV